MRHAAPQLPEGIQFSDLDRDARGRLRTLTKDNAETVGLHLVAAGLFLDTEPEAAYEHAQEAVRRAGRVDIVREAAGLTAYRTERFAEALRELRTVRRLNGSSEHLAIMADCERGLGRPERAIALAATPEAETLDDDQKVELAIVVSGARLDLGEIEAAESVLAGITVPKGERPLQVRVIEARAGVLEAAGRSDEAKALLATLTTKERAEIGDLAPEEDVVVFDLGDEEIDDESDDTDGADDVSSDDDATDDATDDASDEDDAPVATPDDAEASEPTDAAGSAPTAEERQDDEQDDA